MRRSTLFSKEQQAFMTKECALICTAFVNATVTFSHQSDKIPRKPFSRAGIICLPVQWLINHQQSFHHGRIENSRHIFKMLEKHSQTNCISIHWSLKESLKERKSFFLSSHSERHHGICLRCNNCTCCDCCLWKATHMCYSSLWWDGWLGRSGHDKWIFETRECRS